MEISTIQSNLSAHEIYARNVEKKPKRWYHHVLDHMTPSKRLVNLYMTRLSVILFFCLFIYGMLHESSLPGSEVFALLFMGFLATIGGKIIQFMKLPPLLGMMIVGFIYRNLESNPYYDQISMKSIGAIREIALAFILMRAGLGLDGEKLMTLKCAVLRLTLIPCSVEATTMGVISHYLLGLPWIFSFMLGWLMSAISPAVVIPIVMNLESLGYGVEKGIPTLIIAATSLDDILAIAGFTICFSLAFSTADLTWTIVKAPLEPLVGIAYGAVVGIVFWQFPAGNMKTAKLIFYNTMQISFGCMSILFLSDKFNLPGAGPLGSICLAFVASIKWRQNERRFRGVRTSTATIWAFIEPFLFALIGSEVTIKTLRESAAYGILSIVCGLILRSIATVITCAGTGLNIKEKIFVCCSWIAKATVQAAIGSQALDYARLHKLDEDKIRYGTLVLNVSVLSIVLTAPLGAILATWLGPVLMTRDVIPDKSDEHFEEEESADVKADESIVNYRSVGGKSSTINLVDDNRSRK